MLGNEVFQFGILEKMSAVFGTLFNEIYIDRTDENGVVQKHMKVPITFGNKDKTLARLAADPKLDRKFSITLPRMEFEISGYEYDGDRKLSTTKKIAKYNPDDKNSFKTLYTPVPYNINYFLSVYAKNITDLYKIIEQILPFFTPDWTPKIELIPDMDEVRNVPFILTGISKADRYTPDFIDREAFVVTMTFTVKTFFYGPIRNKPIIKFAKTDYFIGDAIAGEGVVEVTTQPGLTSTGEPTSNNAASINIDDIGAQDNFGYIVIVDDSFTGLT